MSTDQLHGWHSKDRRFERVAHFLVDGPTLCSFVTYNDGTPALAPFKCGWVPMREGDHKCSMCVRELRRSA